MSSDFEIENQNPFKQDNPFEQDNIQFDNGNVGFNPDMGSYGSSQR